MNIISKPEHRGNNATQYGAALIVVTDWKIWDSTQSSYRQVVPPFSTEENGPITFEYIAKTNE